MPKIEMGVGFKVLTGAVTVLVFVAIGVFSGKEYAENSQIESNIEVMRVDSHVAQEIETQTKELRVKADEKIKRFKKPIVDSSGYLSTEFMQLLESAKSTAERRGNETGLLHAITKP